MSDESKSQAGQTVLVVGASSGIGLTLVSTLVANGATVFATTRRESPDLEASGATVISGVDVSDDGVGAVLLAGLGDTKLDVLVHNAGVVSLGGLDAFDSKNWMNTLNINTLGPQRVIKALSEGDSPAVKEGGKIVVVSSSAGSLTLNAAAPTAFLATSYRASKAALNFALITIAAELKPKKIAVLAICPGVVKTRMTDPFGKEGQEAMGAITQEQSAAHIVEKIGLLNIENSGSFWGTDDLPMMGISGDKSRPW